MRKYLVLSLAVVLVFGLGSVALAQDTDTATQTVTITVDEIVEIAVTPDTLTLTISTATAGAPPDDDTDDSTYAQYTSVVSEGETRTIDAAITAGTIPTGLELKLEAATPTGGEGTVGSGVADGVTFTGSTGGGSIIENIGSCATGTGTNVGAQLTYTLSVADFASLVAGTTDVTVTFTLTDAA